MVLCPCGSDRDYENCCGPIIAGTPAPTAEALVRSRYTAFVRRELDHVANTHAPEIREDFNRAEAERVAEQCEWRGLEIRRATETGDTAEVEFVVRFRLEHQESTTLSVSCFRRDHGQWLYVRARKSQLAPQRTTKVGRNDLCPCNSGKKAKKCCGVTTAVK